MKTALGKDDVSEVTVCVELVVVALLVPAKEANAVLHDEGTKRGYHE
jgi:hypothetical protein